MLTRHTEVGASASDADFYNFCATTLAWGAFFSENSGEIYVTSLFAFGIYIISIG